MTSTTQPPRSIVVAATWWLWLLRAGDRLGGLRRRLRGDRGVRVSVQVGAPLIVRRQALAGWLEQTGRAVFDAHDEPPMPIRVIVTSEAGLPGSHDLGWVRAAYRVVDGPHGRRAIVWLGALQPQPASQRVDDWLAAGLTWALFCLVTWDETLPRLAALPMPGVTITTPPGGLGGAPAPADPPSPAPGDLRSPTGQRSVRGLTINSQPLDTRPAQGTASDIGGPVAATGEAMVPLTTSAPPAALSYPAEE